MRCIELFAGAGGAALGLEAAGFHHTALVEWDADACAIMRSAGLHPVVEGDVRDLNAIDATVRASWWTENTAYDRAGDLLVDSALEGDEWVLEREALATRLMSESRKTGLIWASFPCQAFSHAGKRKGSADERNGWPWTVDAIDRFSPTWLVAENVRGLLSMPYFEEVILPDLKTRFAHVGYFVLDAASFGVPQRRRRVFIWAGPAPVRAPTPTHGSPGAQRQLSLLRGPLLPWVSMGEALGLSGNQQVSKRQHGARGHQPHDSHQPAPTVRAGSHADNGIRIIGGGRNPQDAGIERTYRDITDEPSTCVTAVQVGNAGPWVLHHQRSSEAHPNQERPTPVTEPAPTIGGKGNQILQRPAPTVTTTEVKGTRASAKSGGTFRGGPDRASDALFVGTGRRRLTVDECAILQDFPPKYPWAEARTKAARYRAVGNAVPPKLAEVVGLAVLEADDALGK